MSGSFNVGEAIFKAQNLEVEDCEGDLSFETKGYEEKAIDILTPDQVRTLILALQEWLAKREGMG